MGNTTRSTTQGYVPPRAVESVFQLILGHGDDGEVGADGEMGEEAQEERTARPTASRS